MFFAENGRLLEEVEELEQRTRRRDIVVDDEALFDFFDERIPADVVSARALRPLVEGRAAAHPDLLTFPRSLLFVRRGASRSIPSSGRPGGSRATWCCG